MALISGIFPPMVTTSLIYIFSLGKILQIYFFFVIFLESNSGARGDDHLEAATATLEESRSYWDIKSGRIK